MSDSLPPPVAAPQFSPDGQWWWSGAEWVAATPPPPPPAAVSAFLPTQQDHRAESPARRDGCPVCLKDDKIQKVQGVLSKGSSVSVIGTGIGMYSEDILVRRFAVPDRPQQETGVFLLLAVFCGLVVLGLVNGTGRPIGVGLLLGALAGAAAMWLGLRFNASRRTRAATWDACWATMSAGFYCFRDDVTFPPGGAATSPETWARQAFATFR